MSSPAERFLDAVVRPFADNAELQIHARRALEERIDPSSADATCWETASEELRRQDGSLLRRRWRWWLWGSVLLGSLACLAPLIQETVEFQHLGSDPFMGRFHEDDFDEPYFQQQLAGTLSDEQRLILFGTPSKTRAGRWEALWKRFPDRPDYYAQYASIHVSERSALPTDFLATAEKIDPGNAWFPALAAAVKSAKTVESRKQSKAQTLAHAPKEWDVLDEPRLAECMALLHQAVTQPRFESYSTRLAAERQALLPPATDSAERMRNLSFTAPGSLAALTFQPLSRAVAAQSWRLANQGQKDEFQHLMADWSLLARLQTESSDRMLEHLILQGSLATTLSNLSDGAERLDLNEQAARLKEASQQAWANNDARRNRAPSSAAEKAVTDHGSALADQTIALMSNMVDNAPVPTVSDLNPGRMVDHANAHRIAGVAVFPVVLILCGACAIYRFRSGSLLRRLSARLIQTLKPVDWAWLFAAAVLPTAHLAILYGWTPLGGRDWGYFNPGIVTKIVQLTAWLLLTMASPVVAARWRLRYRLPGLAIANRSPLGLGILASLGYLASCIAGIYYLHPHPEPPIEVEFFEGTYKLPSGMDAPAMAVAMLLPLLLWWLAALTRAIFTHRDRALGRQVVSRMLVPAWIFLLLPVALLIPLCKLQERYWISRDSLLAPGPSLTTYEGQIIARMKEENLKILRPLTPDR
ncbi:hypothetical protein [Luteolibacter sp. LG18]|uniref:hypothetical protein n=1 Tax=Luteolibacter sp. LG18 TaxID=2819286 RepID=UPI002B295F4E|nr:hypothetical protein llg_19760 [Luteolibacter sp. LG18]